MRLDREFIRTNVQNWKFVKGGTGATTLIQSGKFVVALIHNEIDAVIIRELVEQARRQGDDTGKS